MPKLTKSAVPPNSEGPGTEWRSELDGYIVSLVKVDADADLTELLKGLPGDQCPSPHWGYVTKGSLWWRYDMDRNETIEAGEAFYVPPGHTSGANAGAEFVVFSPAETMGEVEAHMARRAQELFGGER